MATTKPDLLQGTLDLLILKTLLLESNHGWGISQRIQQMSKDVLSVNQGSLYPALSRLEEQDLISAEWGVSENNRRARFYSLTKSGRRQLGDRNGALAENVGRHQPGRRSRLVQHDDCLDSPPSVSLAHGAGPPRARAATRRRAALPPRDADQRQHQSGPGAGDRPGDGAAPVRQHRGAQGQLSGSLGGPAARDAAAGCPERHPEPGGPSDDVGRDCRGHGARHWRQLCGLHGVQCGRAAPAALRRLAAARAAEGVDAIRQRQRNPVLRARDPRSARTGRHAQRRRGIPLHVLHPARPR